MKAVKIAELKTHLSRYLREVRGGERIVVMDRDEPVAELVPLRPATESPWERMAREGRVRLGTQDWETFKVTKLKKSVDIQRLLAEVREDLE